MLQNITVETGVGIISGIVVTVIVGVWPSVRRWLDQHPWASGASAGAIAALLLSGVGSGTPTTIPTVERVAEHLAENFSEELRGKRGIPGVSSALPSGIITASTIECSDLGPDWRAYNQANGRVIIGVGGAQDEAGETRVFDLSEQGGTYRHQLSATEMPSHNHPGSALHDTPMVLVNMPGDMETQQISDRRGQPVALLRSMTVRVNSQGGDEPHNNMPPFLTLHYCQKSS